MDKTYLYTLQVKYPNGEVQDFGNGKEGVSQGTRPIFDLMHRIGIDGYVSLTVVSADTRVANGICNGIQYDLSISDLTCRYR